MGKAIRTNKVKTRKVHKCWGCERKFEKGTEMEVVVWVEDGEITNYYWCEVCGKYWREEMNDDDTVIVGEVRDMIGWEELRRKLEDA